MVCIDHNNVHFFYCFLNRTKNAKHSVFNTEHAGVNKHNIYKFHCNLRKITRVRSETDIQQACGSQVNRNNKQFLKPCLKISF